MSVFNRVRTTSVNGKAVQIYMLPAMEGLKIAQKLAQVVLPTVGAFYQGVTSDSLNFEALAITVVEEIGSLDISELTERLLRGLAVDGREVNFDEYFSGNYGELVKILSFALEENFSSFFEAKGLFDKFLPKVEAPKLDQPQVESQTK